MRESSAPIAAAAGASTGAEIAPDSLIFNGDLPSRTRSRLNPSKIHSIFCQPPASARAALGTSKPAGSFCLAEQTAVTVAAIRMLAELARTALRHRAAR
jgi:hypothetical protein